ncbi:MAG: DoxX family protein [Acidobacteriaceae bacterium]
MAKSAGSGSGAGDFGLLVLRVVLGATLFFKHGLEKITHFSQMSAHFPNPLHVGSHVSLIFALLSDAICSLLVVLGLGTRFAAFIIAVNMSVALYFVHHMALRSEHGEMMLIYIAGFIALIFAGGGRFSFDWKLWGRS